VGRLVDDLCGALAFATDAAGLPAQGASDEAALAVAGGAGVAAGLRVAGDLLADLEVRPTARNQVNFIPLLSDKTPQPSTLLLHQGGRLSGSRTKPLHPTRGTSGRGAARTAALRRRSALAASSGHGRVGAVRCRRRRRRVATRVGRPRSSRRGRSDRGGRRGHR